MTDLFITVVGAGALLLVGTGVGSRARATAAGKIQDALQLAVVEEEVERPDIAHLACVCRPPQPG